MDCSVMERLERLERQNNLFKRVGIALILLVVALGVMGQSTGINREVKAQKFSLYDSAGRHRGMSFVSQEGQAIFILADNRGEPRLTLTVGPNGDPGMGLTDSNNKLRADFSLLRDNPRLGLYSPQEREQVLVHVGKDGFPRIGLMDNSRSPRVALGAVEGRWVVATYGQKGESTGGIGNQ